MAKTANKDRQRDWWVNGLIGLVSLGIAYGFASWAIDSGQLFHYALAIGFLYFGLSSLVRSIRFAIAK